MALETNLEDSKNLKEFENLLKEDFKKRELKEGGIIKAQATISIEETASVVGFVIAMGPDCYQDKKRFPNGPWCSEGDFIIMRAYSGTRISIHGKEFRIINDDTVEAVVDDPRGISRV